jgi:hypothetical protein
MADKNDRPSAEYSLPGAAKPERFTGVPRLGPLVAGKVQAQKPNVPPPVPKRPRLADMRPVHAPRNQRTLTGVAPPPKGTPAPPVPLPAPELDSTVESPRVDRVRPPVSMPPRSISPAPVSVSPDGVKVRWSGIKKALPWLLLGGTAGGGGVGGYFAGLKFEYAERAAIKAQGIENARRVDDLAAEKAQLLQRVQRVEATMKTLTDGLAAEAQSNRTERATRDRQIDQIEQRLPKIEGLPKP